MHGCVQNNLAFFPFMHCPLVANWKTRWSIKVCHVTRNKVSLLIVISIKMKLFRNIVLWKYKNWKEAMVSQWVFWKRQKLFIIFKFVMKSVPMQADVINLSTFQASKNFVQSFKTSRGTSVTRSQTPDSATLVAKSSFPALKWENSILIENFFTINEMKRWWLCGRQGFKSRLLQKECFLT